MIVRVSDLDEDGIHIETSERPEWLVNVPELLDGAKPSHIASGFDIDIQVNKVLKEVTVNGNVSFSVEDQCSRCLKKVSIDLKPDINLVITPEEGIDHEDDDLNHETYVGDEVDISNYIREQIAMSLPLKVVCREDCKGLCADCGINLNEKECECSGQKIDPRLEVLKNLKI